MRDEKRGQGAKGYWRGEAEGDYSLALIARRGV